MHAKAGESDRAIRVKKVLPLRWHMFSCSEADVLHSSRSTCLLENGRPAKRTDVDSDVSQVLSVLLVGILLFSLIHVVMSLHA